MSHLPSFESFRAHAAGHTLVPVYRRLLSDSLTPVSVFQQINVGTHACLFESVIGGEKVGRYSFVAAEPFLEIVAYGNNVTIRKSGREVEKFTSKSPLDDLRSRLAGFRAAHLPELPPFTGGAIGYAGYDVVRYVENLPSAPTDDRQLPDLAFALYDEMVVFDHVSKALYVIAMARLDEKSDPRAAYDDAAARIDAIVAKLAHPVDLPITDIPAAKSSVGLEVKSNFPQEAYEAAVRKCVDYIRAGDIFQVVLSQRMQLTVDCDPLEIYRTLRVVNPSPFMFYLRMPEVTLVGSSPEIMCRVVDGKVTVRPLAGTRPRGATEEEDRRLADELLADPKERAEHVMLVDLGRNDVGRVAKFGSVEISDVMVIERYSHVMHITSNVTGELAEGNDAFDALGACLPAGTVSGAPKVRAMQIIDELEPHRRGPYAGAVGYIDYCGNMDTCIALRTLVVKGSEAYIQAGAGIVADSVPSMEYQETLNKARGLLKAIEITQQRLKS
ncbi:anthranilate synthase component I [Pirellula staleyi DSM 6068]|uniref:Anthranilate synthase component 1 n=1 Tax=Pirellula staleyi (strain ATCC 27377 / DSM 6068 / ICPB 4128) TaxID=530564 RepID=D2R0Z9_PIRSD|nr:anthranilate synthase component I [Pirellula staleyi]ADB18484.1 anthranilate synthase component I [Pirellula staleyi DSM 6068]